MLDYGGGTDLDGIKEAVDALRRKYTMSKVIIAIVAMFALMIFPGAGFWNLLSNVVGGGVAESFLYPIYGGLILLAGLVVGCTVLILEEIQSLKEKIDDLSNK